MKNHTLGKELIRSQSGRSPEKGGDEKGTEQHKTSTETTRQPKKRGKKKSRRRTPQNCEAAKKRDVSREISWAKAAGGGGGGGGGGGAAIADQKV